MLGPGKWTTALALLQAVESSGNQSAPWEHQIRPQAAKTRAHL